LKAKKEGEESDFTDDEDENEDEQMADANDDKNSEHFSLASSDEGEDEESGSKMGFDKLMSKDLDIPTVRDIPVVAKLGRSQKQEAKGKLEKMQENRD